LYNFFKPAPSPILNERCTGSDFTKLVISDPRFDRIFVVGGNNHIKLYDLRPLSNKDWLRFYDGEVTEQSKGLLLGKIREFGPSLVLIALDTAKAVSLASYFKENSTNNVLVGVGSAIDFLVGSKKRAPMFLQNLGLEWVWRFLSEPRRLFVRYFIVSPVSFFSLFFSSSSKNQG
jgi:exopolysaccharide biosynthesis WecB/TagA/CpsF family protein